MSVVGGVFDEGGENYSLLSSQGEVVVIAGHVVSQIPDVNGVKVEGVGDVGDEANRRTQGLVLLIITTVIRAVIINLTIHIVVLLNDGN